MAFSDSASSSPECRATRLHFASLAKAIDDPLGLSMELFSKEIIEYATMEKAKLPHQTHGEKNSILLLAVMRRMEAKPSLFHRFVAVLKDNGDHILRELGRKLETTYSEYLKQLTPDSKEQSFSATKHVQYSPLAPTQLYPLSKPTKYSPHLQTKRTRSSSPPMTEQIDIPPSPLPKRTKHPLPFPAAYPSLLVPLPQSPVHCYADYLRAFYQTSELPASDKWPPSPSKIFINLAIISRENVGRKDLEKFMLATLRGDVDQIIDIKAPIEIGDIVSSQPGKTLQCILVEGAPGVGKSTLAWEACKQWGKGNLFQQFVIIMLLRLRDQTVQNATSITDLVFPQDQDCIQDISQQLKDNKGRNTLIILEGLDELPKQLLTQASIFTHLLSGKLLPHATILVTSRPSATAHLWKNWKHRISRHIEVLGFTEENITQYIESTLSHQELHSFENYLSINPHIRTIMYIPLHAAIVIEVYKMCQDSSWTLPTTITELYTCFVQTILLRYITSQPDYRDLEEQIDLDRFTNLPPHVYDLFYNLTQLAYNGVTNRQLIFKHQQHTIQHLGFMDAVTELFPNKLAVSYSYNFLHLSIQEYLAAYYISTMETPQQEQLLQRMCADTHLQNTGRFLAGITKFKGMNKDIVKKTIHEECKSTVELGWKEEPTQLSTHALHLLYESGDANILDSNQSYGCPLTDHYPLFAFFALGYCITHSNCKWSLSLGTYGQLMKSTERIEMLVKVLSSSSDSSNTYNIEEIVCRHDAPECVEQLLKLPENILQQLQRIGLIGNHQNPQPLPQSLPQVILTMTSLNRLDLVSATGATTLHRTVQAVISKHNLEVLALSDCDIDDECVTTLCRWLSTSPQLETLQISLLSPNAIERISTALITNSTLKTLSLQGSKFNCPVMRAMCSMLTHNTTVTRVVLRDCHIGDDIICCLAEGLHGNNKITALNISQNSISDRGAACMAEILKTNNTLQEVDLSKNSIGITGQLALKEVEEIKKYIKFNYTQQIENKEEKMKVEGGEEVKEKQ